VQTEVGIALTLLTIFICCSICVVSFFAALQPAKWLLFSFLILTGKQTNGEERKYAINRHQRRRRGKGKVMNVNEHVQQHRTVTFFSWLMFRCGGANNTTFRELSENSSLS
jgi:hypothetical protein